MNGPDIPIGAKVQVSAGVGIVRWTGINPKFSSGRWIGIQLETPTGKNNGSVQGEQYFECQQGYGVFVRRSQATLIDLPTPASATSRATRPSSSRATPPSSVTRVGASGQTSRSSTPATPPGASAKPPVRTSSGTSITSAGSTSSQRTSGAGPSGTPGTVRRLASTGPKAPGVRPSPLTGPGRRRMSTTGSTPSGTTPILSPVPAASRRPSTAAATSRKASTAASTAAASRRGSLAPLPASPAAARDRNAPPSTPTSAVDRAVDRERDRNAMPPPPVPVPVSSPRPAVQSPAVPPHNPRSSGLPVPSSPARSSGRLSVPASPAARTPVALPQPVSESKPTTPDITEQELPTDHNDPESEGEEEEDVSQVVEIEVEDDGSQPTITSPSSATPTVATMAQPPQLQPPSISPRLRMAQLTPDVELVAMVSSQKREIEELKLKIRLMDARRLEDQERINGLEKRAGDADQLAAIRAKLQTKFQEQQTALVTTQRLARDLQSENAHLETRAAEALEQLEMATLDREIAEEKAEASEAEVAKLNEEIQELEMEIAVLKEENEEYEKPIHGVEGERSSIAFVQLEKHNERLKEALIRLRDVANETEREQRGKITDLEKELGEQEDLRSRLELSEAKLAHNEAQVEDLKQQLDDALGAEHLLEDLTERNLQMSERIEEMRLTIEDLESLRDLNDELEENHVATEKQMDQEIALLQSQLRDERIRATDLESIVVDAEATINQFRELVAALQSEIDTLRAQQVTQEHESANASKESQVLLNLNMKLQSSVAKTQSKMIDFELKKLEAAQLSEHLRIVQAYLPEAYLESEIDSATALLFFHRVASKVDMLVNVISQVHGLPTALHNVTSDALVGVCELRGKLRHFATLNRRFAAVMRRTEPDDYVDLGKVAGELIGVEPKVDGWISLVKSDEFNEGDCVRELDALISQFNHLAEVMFERPGLDAAEQQLDLAYSFEDDLDNFAAAVGFVRQIVQMLVKEGEVDVDLGESSLEESVYDPVQRILNQVRSVKTPAGKLVEVVEEAVQAQMALLPEFTKALGDLVKPISNAVDIAIQVAQRIGMHVSSIRASKQPLRLADIDKFVAEVTSQVAPNQSVPWEVVNNLITRVGVELGDILPKFRNAAKAGQMVSVDSPEPWLARVVAIKEAALYNAEAERKVSRLSDELKDMVREVKLRDQSLQESGVKVETLERRLEALRKLADVNLELENDVAKAKKQEKVYEEAIEQLQAEQDALETENARLRKSRGTDTNNASSAAPTPGDSMFIGVSAGSVEASHLVEQIENLKSAVRFLRSENSLLKAKDLYEDVRMLRPLRPTSHFTAAAPVPPLDADTGSDSDTDSDGPVTPRIIARAAPPNSRSALDTESKLLFREVAAFAAKPRIVNISGLGAGGSAWRSRKNSPQAQMWRFDNERRGLERKVEQLAERVGALRALR